MTEMAIIGNEFRRFSELVNVDRATDKRLYYSYQDGMGRPTYCEISRVRVRNATRELFLKLKSMEGDHDRGKREAIARMDEQFAERCRKAIVGAALVTAEAATNA